MSAIPASLKVSWEPPPKKDRNGPISYRIEYTRAKGSNDTVTVSSETTHTILSRLYPFVTYLVRVAASTVNGTGPYSIDVVQMSGEDG